MTKKNETSSKPVIKGKKLLVKEEFAQVFKFDRKGDSITGQVKAVREVTTKYGDCNYIDIVELETGELTSIVESSNLKGYNFPSVLDQYVEITFVDYERNPATKNMYKSFEVNVLEVE